VTFPTGGNSATIVDTYLQGSNIQFDSAAYTVNENVGTVTFQVDRSFFGGQTSGSASAIFSTADGVPYTYGSLKYPDDAQAGRDYTAVTSYTVNFTGTATTALV
jgi:hypothetical protein